MPRSLFLTCCIIPFLISRLTAQDGNSSVRVQLADAVLQDDQPEPTLPEVEVTPPTTPFDQPPLSDVEVTPSTTPQFAFTLPGDLFRGGAVEGYRADGAVIATRVYTPILETPWTIQVIPQQVLRDQQILRIHKAVDNVSSVFRGDGFGDTVDDFWIRGFRQSNTYRDGARLGRNISLNITDPQNIERIEVLKGPASIFYGQIEPGGLINIVTKRPRGESFTDFRQTFGSFNTTRTTLDTSGRLDGDDGKFLYRINAVYENSDTFVDYPDGLGTERTFVAPVLTWLISEDTSLTFEFNYTRQQRPVDRGMVLFNNGTIPNVPFNRFMGDTIADSKTKEYIYGTEFNHRFNDVFSVRHKFLGVSNFTDDLQVRPRGLANNGDLRRRTDGNRDRSSSVLYSAVDLVFELDDAFDSTAVVGTDFFKFFDRRTFVRSADFTNFNIFNPVYGVADTNIISRTPAGDDLTWYGLYTQYQANLNERLYATLGGRYDWSKASSFFGGTPNNRSDEAFTGRAGLLYRPFEDLSIFGSFSESFNPNTTRSLDPLGNPLRPQTGEQWEGGLKMEFLDGKLLATVTGFLINQRDIALSIAPGVADTIGAVRSQGVEMDIVGNLNENWSTIVSYAYIDARIIDDNDPTRIGRRQQNTPYNSGSIWLAYNRTVGHRGHNRLGGGVGVYLFDDIPGLNIFGPPAPGSVSTFLLPGYVRTDFAVWYRTPKWDAQVNVENLFNQQYLASSGFSNLRITPGAPITVLTQLSLKY